MNRMWGGKGRKHGVLTLLWSLITVVVGSCLDAEEQYQGYFACFPFLGDNKPKSKSQAA